MSTISQVPAELKPKHKEAFEVDPLWALKLAAARGKWIDQSQSHNVFMTGTSGKQLNEIYVTAWKMGLKTTYYLRTLAATQIEKSTLDAGKYGYTQTRQYDLPIAATADAAAPDAAAPDAAASSAATAADAHGANGKVAAASDPGASAPELCRIDDPDCEACQ